MGSDKSLLFWLRYLGSLSVGQQPAKPCLIEEHLLVSCLPERTNLLCLTSDGESLALYREDHEVFEVIDIRISEASLPIGDGATPNAKQVR